MTQEEQTAGARIRIARNTLYNIATQGGMVLLGLWAIPVILAGISDERFGLLALVWAILGYFGLLDLGIGRAVTKYLAEAVSRDAHEEIRSLIGVSLGMTAVIGTGTLVLLVLVTPWMTTSFLSISPHLAHEARLAFHWTALAIPFVLVSGVARAAQMAYQRFDLVNIFQGGLGIVQWVGAVLCVAVGLGFVEIVAVAVMARILAAVGSVAALTKLAPGSWRLGFRWNSGPAKKLVRYGGWVTVSQLISPLFQYVDRFLIATLVTVSAVTYYSIPQEIVTRLLVIPMSLSLVLFPAFSSSERETSSLYVRSTKYLLLLVLPVTLVSVAFAYDMAAWWIGARFAEESAILFQILAVGYLFNALAQIPSATLQARGYPDITAKLHLLEIIPTLVLTIALVVTLGLTGVAIAWTFRVGADCVLLFLAVRRYLPDVRGEVALFPELKSVFPLAAAVALYVAALIIPTGGVSIALIGCSLLVYAISVWFFLLDTSDRAFLLQLRTRLWQAA